jgi:chromosome segregation ATPase
MTATEILDQAITNIESLSRGLYSLRKLAADKGNLDEQRTSLARGIDALKSHLADLEKQAQDKRDDLADISQQRQALDSELAGLNSQITTARTELTALHKAVDQVKTMLRAA